jgi:hypothetical protein
MRYDPQDIVLDAELLRRRAAQCARLSRTLRGTDAAVLEALAREYESEAKKLEGGRGRAV